MSDTNNTEAHVPIDAGTRDKSSPVWDMSQERVFIENLLIRGLLLPRRLLARPGGRHQLQGSA